MKNLKQIVDTVAVLVGKLLSFEFVSWKQAEEAAATMNAEVELAKANAKVELVDGEGNAIKTEIPLPPLGYLAAETINVLSLVAGIVILYYLAKATLRVMMYLFVIGLAIAAINEVAKLFRKENKDVPAPAQTAAA